MTRLRTIQSKILIFWVFTSSMGILTSNTPEQSFPFWIYSPNLEVFMAQSSSFWAWLADSTTRECSSVSWLAACTFWKRVPRKMVRPAKVISWRLSRCQKMWRRSDLRLKMCLVRSSWHAVLPAARRRRRRVKSFWVGRSTYIMLAMIW